ncbi:Two-component system protein B [Cladobotryum mycophilum]|uniref:Two-component system protein B n=1 Tax=Cladobotryum mycophilum TaxID=491253 RepID=A0ABR0SQC5_9HYPO
MRVAIREQLAALVIFAVLIALAIVSIPTWIFVHNFVIDVESDGLSLTASLKASRIASELDLAQTICQTVATRILLQQAFVDFYNGNSTNPFDNARADLQIAMSTARLTGLLQARLYSRNDTGDPNGLVSVTGTGVGNQTDNIQLPYLAPDGSRVNLSDTEFGYPPSLYPNITYMNLGYPNPYVPSTPAFGAYAFPGVNLTGGGGLVLGPLIINETYALISLTVPVRSFSIANFILGYMTLIISAGSLIDVQLSREGLSSTGVVLLVGPDHPSNRFNTTLRPSNNTYSPPKHAFANTLVRFVLPPISVLGQTNRHSNQDYVDGDYDKSFTVSQYPALLDVYSRKISQPNNSTAILSTKNEQGVPVAVGVARPESTLVDWAIVVEKARSEAYEPIDTLRNILLGCVFGTAGLVILLVFPCAHLSVLPIRRLKTATEKSIAPPGYEDEFDEDFDEEHPGSGANSSQRSKKGILASIHRRLFKRRKARATDGDSEAHRRVFKIPGRVEVRKHYVTDELTELTQTFNEMTSELLKQYTSLEEKVAERTRELEISKRAAEAANESKTLFIANISHELKTPLNGIMGMCAVCMEEDDVMRIKQSLKTLYRSGDLLLHLLEDLLSFSKNQIGQHVSLEEKEFRLGDIRSQMLSIFDMQVRESKITFAVNFISSDAVNGELSVSPEPISIEKKLPALGPSGMGRLKDAYLWGDQHRILQVMINLVSNSLKFTPAGGRVQLRIRCIGEVERGSDDSRTSSFSRSGSGRVGRSRHRASSGSTRSATSRATGNTLGTALAINPMDPKATPHVQIRERSPTPPPPNAKPYMFEFEVEDTGPGIPDHMQEKIFEPFVQGDLGLSKRFGGTGLGLSICSQLAKLMGGSIALSSTVGVGSTPPSVGSNGGNHRNSLNGSTPEQTTTNSTSNVLEGKLPRLVGLSAPFFAAKPNAALPSKEDQAAVIDKAMANKAGQGKLRVLIADDNSTNIEVVSRMLKLEDVYDVSIASDGQEAYELVKANMERNLRFDVIFMDVQMPNLDGLQSTRLIRKMGYSEPIVALTAFSEESNVKECIESGMDEFLSKPIRRPALKKVLKKFVTIPEEPEIAGVTKRAAMDKMPKAMNGSSPAVTV